MDSQDLLKISTDDEMHKKHKKRTKKIKAQLQEQVQLHVLAYDCKILKISLPTPNPQK